MTLIDNLAGNSCIPCSGIIPPLKKEEIDSHLDSLPTKWLINKAGHLYKTFLFSDFKQVMQFANIIAEIAEKENHHPNLEISFGRCGVEIWTHKINGLAKSDFILAAKIDAIRV